MCSAVRTPIDERGRPLAEGDPVQGNSWGFPGERGVVTRAAGGALINVRLESSGLTVSSAAHLWRKLDAQ